MIIVGSAALKQVLDWREPRDIDAFSTPSDVCHSWDIIEVPLHILNLIPVYGVQCHLYNEVDETWYPCATKDAVYTIKMSHLGWDIKWKKHYNDVRNLSKLGAKLLPNLYEALVKHWTEVNGNNPNLSLYKKKGDFFNDAVPYVYDHDYLHMVVAWPKQPAYTLCLKEGEDVMIDKDKFFSLLLKQQLRMFKEEITVIAAERWLINPVCAGKYHWLQAYDMALHKTITALTKGWATDFMLKHLDFFSRPEYSYFYNLFDEGIIMSKKLSDSEKNRIMDEVLAALGIDENGFESLMWEDYEPHPFYEHIEQVGGEDEGSYAHLVFKWKGQMYKFVFSYYSHDGYNFDYSELYEVEAKEKTITVYE